MNCKICFQHLLVLEMISLKKIFITVAMLYNREKKFTDCRAGLEKQDVPVLSLFLSDCLAHLLSRLLLSRQTA